VRRAGIRGDDFQDLPVESGIELVKRKLPMEETKVHEVYLARLTILPAKKLRMPTHV
jgi:hypothetical protein